MTKLEEGLAGQDEPAECCICKESVELGSETTVLESGHWFRSQCIEEWLGQLNMPSTCPLCRGLAMRLAHSWEV